MSADQKKIEEMKDILRKIQFIEYTDPDEGLVIWCPVCAGYPEPKYLTPGMKNHMSPGRARNGRGHDKDCELAKAIES